MRGETERSDVRHQWRRDNQDPEHLQHSAHEHWHVSAQFSCLLVRFLSSWFTHCTAWLKGVAHVISSMHEVCGSPSTLSPPFPSTSSSSHSSFSSCTSSCTSSTILRAVASLCTPPKRVWTLLTTPTSSHLREVRIWVNTVLKLTSRKTEIARSARGPKSQGHRAEDALAESYFVQKILVIWLQQITKFSVMVVNLETIIDMQSWCRTWLPNGSSRIRAKQKLLRKHKEACKSSWSRVGSLKSFTLTIPWNLAKLVKIFPGIIVRRHHIDQKQMGLLREQCAEWKKVHLQYCCNQVWMKIGGQIPWNAIPICEAFKISCLMGRLHAKDVLENHLRGPIILFGSLNGYYPFSAKDQSRIHQFGKRVLPGLFLGYALYAGGIWKGDKMVADIEELETMDASEIYARRLNAKEVIFPKDNGKLIFPVADGRIKFSGGDQELRTSTLIREHPIWGDSWRDSLGESGGSPPPLPQDSYPDAGEARNDFWSISGKSIYGHHVEPRAKLHSPREESLPIPLKYIDVSRTARTNLDVMQESRIGDYWNIDGSRDLSDYWTGFTQFILLEEKPPDGFYGPGGDWQNGKRHPGQIIYGQNSGRKLGRNAKLKEKQKWSMEKPKLDNARRLRGI